MIFVTVGSIHFDTLVQIIDEAVVRGDIAGEVLLQIGNGDYLPKHCQYFRTAPGLGPYYERAELIVGHGGTGTTMEIIERGIRLISVSNPSMIDNHQHEFLESLEGKGLTTYCRDLKRLPEYIRQRLAQPAPQPFGINSFFKKVVDDLEAFLKL